MFFLKYVAYAFCLLLFSFVISMLVGMFLRRMTSVDEKSEKEAYGMMQSRARRHKGPKGVARKAAGTLR